MRSGGQAVHESPEHGGEWAIVRVQPVVLAGRSPDGPSWAPDTAESCVIPLAWLGRCKQLPVGGFRDHPPPSTVVLPRGFIRDGHKLGCGT
jgi:hypothetical protein